MSYAGATAVERPGNRRSRVAPASLFPVLLAALLLIVLAGGGVAHANGIRWYNIKTPSMGTALPVGSLVVTKPTHVADVHTGDVVTFTAPSGATYSHRVVANTGTELTTKGDINGTPDPWRITDKTLVGVSIFHTRYLGWAVVGAPYLCVGWLLVALLTAVVSPRWRRRTGFLGTILVLDAVLMWLRPFTGAVALAYQQVDGGMRAFVVSTGIFPIRVAAQTGGYVDLKLGEYAPVLATAPNAQGRFLFTPTLHMSWAWWLGVIVVSLLPLAYSVLVGFPEAGDEDDAPRGGGSGRFRRVLAASAGLAILASGAAAEPAHAAFTSSLRNTQDSVGTRTFFTCLDAMMAYNTASPTSPLSGRLYTGYSLGSPAASGGQGNNAPYALTTAGVTNTTTANVGCVSDAKTRSQVGYTLNGTTSRLDLGAGSSISPSTPDPGQMDNLTWQAWFRTSSATGGVLSCAAGADDVCYYDSTYMTNDGRVAFTHNGSTITSTASYNDGKWHMVDAQISGTKATLWVDAKVVATSSTFTTTGGLPIDYPQWGFTASSQSWPNQPTSLRYTGDLQFIAIYGRDVNGKQLAQSDINAIYQSAF